MYRHIQIVWAYSKVKTVLGDKQTQIPSKKVKVEGIRSLTHVEFVNPLMSLQHATPNTERHLYFFSC